MLEVKKVVIHEIIKIIKEKKADKYFAEALVPVGDETCNAYKLIDKVNKAYDEDEIVYSSFLKSDNSNFPETYEQYFSSKNEDDNFLLFSTDTLEELRKKLINVPAAKGGGIMYMLSMLSTTKISLGFF